MSTQENINKIKGLGINAEPITLVSEAHNATEVRAFMPPEIALTEDCIVKTLIMFLDDCPKIILLPGNKKIDFRKLKELTKAEMMRMADYDEAEKIGQVGALCPFNLDVDIFVDQTLAKKEKVAINLGTLKDCAIISGKDLEKINNVKIADLI